MQKKSQNPRQSQSRSRPDSIMDDQKLIESYYRRNGFVKNQLASYNSFIEDILPDILKKNTTIEATSEDEKTTHIIRILHRTLKVHPCFIQESDGITRNLSLNECRVRKLDYNAVVTCDIESKCKKYIFVHRDMKAVVPLKTCAISVDCLKRNEIRCDTDIDELSVLDFVIGTFDKERFFFFQKNVGAIEEIQTKILISVETRVEEKVEIFRIPLMVGSNLCTSIYKVFDKNECVYDDGGYFLISGHEKAILFQKKVRINTIFVFKGRRNTKIKFIAEVRSVASQNKWRSTSTFRMALVTKYNIYGQIPFIYKSSNALLQIPLHTLYELLENLHNDEHSTFVWIKEKCCNPNKNYVTTVVRKEIFPHIGTDTSPRTRSLKLEYAKMMVGRLFDVAFGDRRPDDRDSLCSQLVEGPGNSISMLFRQHFRAHLTSLQYNITKYLKSGKQITLNTFMNRKRMTNSFKHHFSTGNWSFSKVNSSMCNGVCQNLSRTSEETKRSHLSRVNTPVNFVLVLVLVLVHVFQHILYHTSSTETVKVLVRACCPCRLSGSYALQSRRRGRLPGC